MGGDRDAPDGRRTAAPDAPAIEAIVVGASAGAVDALSVILPTLPHDFPLPLLIVVHVPPDRESVLSDIFRLMCHVPVKEAEDKEIIQAGTVYFAPPDYHLLVEPDRRLSLSNEEAVRFSRPSIDVLFESAADVFGPGLIGVILTGANSDGADGMRAVCNAGGVGVVQDPEHSQVSTMPRAALDACPEARTMNLNEISTFLREAVQTRYRRC